MIPFPSRVPALLFPQRAAEHAAVSAPRERQCSSSRSNWISKLLRFLRSHSLPNAASRKRFSPRTKEQPAPVPSVFGAPCSASTVPALALHLERDSMDRFPSRPSVPLSALPAVLLPSAAGACGQSRSSPRFDRPMYQNSIALQIAPAFGTRARRPPGPPLRHRADSRSSGRPAGKRCGCAAPQERDRHHDRPRACAPRRWRRSLRWPGCYRRSVASDSLDRIRGLRLGLAQRLIYQQDGASWALERYYGKEGCSTCPERAEGCSCPVRQRIALSRTLQSLLRYLFTSFFHSYLSATMGSTRIALLAGTKHAANPTMIKIIPKPANVSGSVALTPNSKLAISGVSPRETRNPRRTPMTVSFIPSRKIIPSTSLRFAPSAIRTPISCVRWATK